MNEDRNDYSKNQEILKSLAKTRPETILYQAMPRHSGSAVAYHLENAQGCDCDMCVGYQWGQESTKAALDAAEQRERAWAIALQSLTPGGSEFVGDPEYCRIYVEQKIARLVESMKRAIKDRKTAEQRERDAVEVIKHYADKANWEEPNTNETVTYVAWKQFPNELHNGYDKAREYLAKHPPAED